MTGSGVLTCKELVELITDYLEGALERSERARFEEHIDTCDGCIAYLDQFRQTIRMTGALSEESLSPQARKDLLETFRFWQRN